MLWKASHQNCCQLSVGKATWKNIRRKSKHLDKFWIRLLPICLWVNLPINQSLIRTEPWVKGLMFRQRRELTESSFKHCKIQRLCLSYSFPLIPSGLESFLPGLSPLGKQGLLAAPNLHPRVSGSTNQILPCLTILGQGGGSSSIGQRVSCATPGRVGTLCYDWQPLQGHRRWWRCKMLLPD